MESDPIDRRRPQCGVSSIAIITLAALIACQSGDDATGLASSTLDDAEIVVSAAEPDTVTVDTTVTIRITGSGFTDSSVATWLIDSTTVAPSIRTLSTTYKSPTELEAIITVSPDAQLRDYSIRVRSKKGKQGIGVERFRIVAKPVALPDQGLGSSALDVNDRDVIVGYVRDASGAQLAVRWTPVDTGWSYTTLGPGTAGAINNDGLIVRQHYDNVNRTFRSWIHLPSGAMVDFGPVYLTGISDNGTLIGSIFDAAFRPIGVAWTQVSATTWSSPQPLPTLPGFTRAGGSDINAAGEITGAVYESTTSDGFTSTTSLAVVWRYRDGQWQTPELIDRELNAQATAINNLGALAGSWLPCLPGTPRCYSSPAFWPFPGGARKVLPTLYNTAGGVSDMNDANQIVGAALVHYNDGSGPLAALVQHAVIWSPEGEWPEDLGAIQPWQAGEAAAINNHGLVVGTADFWNPPSHAMLWILPRTPMVSPRLPSRSR